MADGAGAGRWQSGRGAHPLAAAFPRAFAPCREWLLLSSGARKFLNKIKLTGIRAQAFI